MSLLSARRLIQRIRRGDRLVADGGIGSELIRSGIQPECTLKVNVRVPEKVRAVHNAYLQSGAEILTCNTFGLLFGTEWAAEINAGIEHALQAARGSEREAAVWASFPGSVVSREAEALRSHVLSAVQRPDIFLIETCTSLDESIAAARAARALARSLLIVTAHFGEDGRMLDGTLPPRLVSALLAEGVDIVGANCGHGPEAFVDVTAQMRAETTTPILVQPSAGLPDRNAAGQWCYPIEPESFADAAVSLFSAGANIVGGCCGTTPAHIAAVRAALKDKG